MLEQLIDAEDYKKLIGLRYPTIFIDKITLRNVEALPVADISCFCVFEVPITMSDDDIEAFKTSVSALPLDLYIGGTRYDFYTV